MLALAAESRVGGGQPRRAGAVERPVSRVSPRGDIRKRRAWAIPALGTALAAAVVGLLVIPSTYMVHPDAESRVASPAPNRNDRVRHKFYGGPTGPAFSVGESPCRNCMTT